MLRFKIFEVLSKVLLAALLVAFRFRIVLVVFAGMSISQHATFLWKFDGTISREAFGGVDLRDVVEVLNAGLDLQKD